MKKKRITKHRNAAPPTSIAWYKPEQWERLIEVSEDRNDLEKTYNEWEAQAEEKLKALRSEGIITKKVLVDVEALLAWCNERGVKVSGSSRSEYVAWLMRKQDRST